MLMALEQQSAGPSRYRWMHCFVAGVFLGLVNHKLILLPAAIFLWRLFDGGQEKTSRRIAAALLHPAVIGFAVASALFWAWGLSVDPAEFYPASQRADDPSGGVAPLAAIPHDRPLVLMVSALIESKRVAEGVRAVAQVPEAFLLVAGDGPQRQAISQLAAELLPGRHLLLGSISNEYMPALFRRATAFLHMSQIEPFGIVYLEAAASGLPIVAPDLAVPRWILGDSALYAHSQDGRSVARALPGAISPDSGPDIGAAARRRVLADWTWDVQASRYRDFIIELLGRGKAEPKQEGHRDLDHHRQLQHM